MKIVHDTILQIRNARYSSRGDEPQLGEWWFVQIPDATDVIEAEFVSATEHTMQLRLKWPNIMQVTDCPRRFARCDVKFLERVAEGQPAVG